MSFLIHSMVLHVVPCGPPWRITTIFDSLLIKSDHIDPNFREEMFKATIGYTKVR